DPAAFELRVILDADPGQHGDLGASQTLDPPVGTRGQTDLFRGDPVAPRGQEFADLRSIVHDSHGNRSRAAQGAPRSTTIDRGSPFSAVSGRIDTTQNHPSEGDIMRAVIMDAPGQIDVTEREDPQIIEPTDAVVRLTATCICGSDLWPYRGIEPVDHLLMGHEYVGLVEEVGSAVTTVGPGDFVVGSFVISDGTCALCRAGYPSKCVNAEFVHGGIGTQAEKARIPYADGTLVATPGRPDADLIPSLLAASDVLGTGWFADAAQVGPGKTVAVVGDGAVGLMGVLAAKQLGAERIIAMSRHADRQALAREFGATDIVTDRGDAGVARVKELTDGLGAHSVIE